VQGLVDHQDKRFAAWTLTAQARQDIDHCFRTQTALTAALGTNANTWTKVFTGAPVKHGVVVAICTQFLEFLERVRDGKESPDVRTHYHRIASELSAKYLDGRATLEVCEGMIEPGELAPGQPKAQTVVRASSRRSN
jgi:hypothetical protein